LTQLVSSLKEQVNSEKIMNSPVLYTSPLPPEAQKALEQIQRKRDYNRSYYHSKVKPKRETERQELDSLRERCSQLEKTITQLHSQLHNPAESSTIRELKGQIQILTNKNFDLSQQISKLLQDNKTLQQALDIARQRNYELMIKRSDDILPNVQGLSFQ
jgi:chromosome segregation ATPase